MLSIENAIKISKVCNVSLDYIYDMSEDINKEISSINTAIRNIIGIKENIVQERNFDNELMYTSTLHISLNECLHQLLIDIGKIKQQIFQKMNKNKQFLKSWCRWHRYLQLFSALLTIDIKSINLLKYIIILIDCNKFIAKSIKIL